MNIMIKVLICYLIGINLAALIACALDKSRAVRGMWRIPERTLIGMAVLGGSVGLLAGMYICHHKTLHKKFTIGVPAILLAQAALCIYLLKFFAGK